MTSWQVARELALSLPHAEQRDHFGSPSFRVAGKIFAQLSNLDQPSSRALVKLTSADQAALALSDPETFSAVPSWGQYGWTYIEIATVDASMLHDLFGDRGDSWHRKNIWLGTRRATGSRA